MLHEIANALFNSCATPSSRSFSIRAYSVHSVSIFSTVENSIIIKK